MMCQAYLVTPWAMSDKYLADVTGGYNFCGDKIVATRKTPKPSP